MTQNLAVSGFINNNNNNNNNTSFYCSPNNKNNKAARARLNRSSLTLDVGLVLGNGTGNGKDDGLLSTPDVSLLKLATPELERLVLQQYLQQQHQVQDEEDVNQLENETQEVSDQVP